MSEKCELLAYKFTKSSEIPKGDELYYRCADCRRIIPSVPKKNLGCECGNIFIDRDYWRLVVADLSKIEILRKIPDF